VESWLANPPKEAAEWDAQRLQRQIVEEFDVEYSITHIHRRFLS
jgi:transposase